nr:GNAT family N-acetyltransferase [Roseomonas acroporae]
MRAIIAERRDDAGPVPIGMAIWHETFSTFSGRHGFWLEDLFVLPDQRRLGVGRALFAELARRVKAEGGTGLGWRVLRWNEPGLRFYRACGGAPNAEWQEMTLTGAALEKLAGG